MSVGEERVLRVTELLRGIDGVEAVIVSYEGLPYSVHAVDPSVRKAAEEIAAKVADYFAATSSSIIGGQPEVILVERMGKAILAADIGGGFSIVALGSPAIVRSVTPSVRRIIAGAEVQCPRCGVSLDVLAYTCPSCGRRVPFVEAFCPFCSAPLNPKTCPSCGRTLSVTPETGVVESSRASVPVASSEGGGSTLSGRARAVIGSVGVVSYVLASWGLGLDPLRAVLLGIIPLGIMAGLLVAFR